MKALIISEDDFNRFKQELLNEIRTILYTEGEEKKKWLRSREVRKLLGNHYCPTKMQILSPAPINA